MDPSPPESSGDMQLAEIVHDLRAPLAPILAAAQMLRARGIHGHEVDAIERNVKRLATMVQDLILDQAGRHRRRFGVVVLEDVLREACDLAAPALSAGGHALRMRCEGRLELLGDAERLVRAVDNLLGNAAKYSLKPDTIELRASLDAHEVVITVEDHGQGVSAEEAGHLFDAYVEPRSAARGAGVGLGLYIVRSIAELHGGTVQVRSAGKGRGATFVLRLPARVAGGACRILLLGRLRDLASSLRSRGVVPHLAGSPGAAVEIAAAVPLTAIAVERAFASDAVQAAVRGAAPGVPLVTVGHDDGPERLEAWIVRSPGPAPDGGFAPRGAQWK